MLCCKKRYLTASKKDVTFCSTYECIFSAYELLCCFYFFFNWIKSFEKRNAMVLDCGIIRLPVDEILYLDRLLLNSNTLIKGSYQLASVVVLVVLLSVLPAFAFAKIK